MRTILLSLLIVSGCLDTAQALGTVKNVPPPIERGAPEPSMVMQTTLCCAEFDDPATYAPGTICVQPRIGQEACDPGTVQMDCGNQLWHLDAIGPLWECR
jgi:hypothetical protein